jgi:TonB-linked SusC/RagA family outer membrane protein
MSLRHLVPALAGSLLLATRLGAQEPRGMITGRVIDGPSQQPLAGVTLRIEATAIGALSGNDGSFRILNAPVGINRVRATRIGYGPQQQDVTVTSGGTATVQFTMQPQAAVLEGVVVTGYGAQRREAITGSVATVDAEAANVGVVTNANQMIQGRVAGVQVTQNNGEPGAGVQIRVRGGTSISASNEPLYVIDGVPIQNEVPEGGGMNSPGGPSVGGAAPAPRNPLNLINPADIASITILKDAAATAIYGSRAANGVVLIETKKGAAGGASTEYDGYVAMATPAKYLDLLSAADYRKFVDDLIAAGTLGADARGGLGSHNTDWQRAMMRNATTHNHNLSFAGGRGETQYRASLNYMDQEGIVIANGFKRLQGRLNGTHQTFENRLRFGLNLMASNVKNDYIPFEGTGGFEGGVFLNTLVYNPTYPVRVVDPATNASTYFELDPGRSVRNPVALAEQIEDFGNSTRALGNVMTELDLVPGLTAQLNLGVDRTDGTRRIYIPSSSIVAQAGGYEGWARQVNRDNTSLTFQSLLTYRRERGDIGFDAVGGYEFNEYSTAEFGADARDFVTDAFSFNNLGGGSELLRPFSFKNESRLVSFFARANVSFRDRYYLTGVVRRDGSSRFGEGHKWATFPAISASWRMSKEPWMPTGPFSDLRLRVGYGLQGNPAVPPYASLITLEPDARARAIFGDETVVGVVPVRNPNPDLKWEQTAQFNVAIDYGLRANQFSGTVEYYIKNTKDLLFTVDAPQPAMVGKGLQNIGRLRNQGLEASLDALAFSRRNLTWVAGLVFAAERNKVIDIGGRTYFPTGQSSGLGQSAVRTQRIIPGHAVGTFFGPVHLGWNPQGQELFRCLTARQTCVNGQTTEPTTDDYVVLGNANPDFTLGLRNQLNWGRLDVSLLVRSEVGHQVFNNTALTYATRTNARQSRNFLRSALTDPTRFGDLAAYSSRWVQDASFVRLQNLTVGYTFNTLPRFAGPVRNARAYVSGDNLILLTPYDGYDPEVHTEAGVDGLLARGIDYLSYPRARTFTAGVRVSF